MQPIFVTSLHLSCKKVFVFTVMFSEQFFYSGSEGVVHSWFLAKPSLLECCALSIERGQPHTPDPDLIMTGTFAKSQFIARKYVGKNAFS